MKIKRNAHLLIYILIILLLGWHLPFGFQLSLYIIAGLVWFLYQKSPKNIKSIPDVKHPNIWLFAIVLIVFLIRIYPFLSGHPAPLGYDTGIYKHEFEQAIKNLPGFFMGIHPGLFFFTDFLSFFGIDANFLIREGYIIINLFIPVLIYITAKEFFGKNAGIIAAGIFAFSSLQFDAYAFMLYKNTLGISFLLFSLILLKRRSYLLLPIGAFLSLLQPTHFLLLGLTLFVLWILNWKNKKDRIFFFVNGAIIGTGALSIFLLNPDLINTALNLLQRKTPLFRGVFLEVAQGVDLMSFYFPLGLIGFFHVLKTKKEKPLIIISVLTALIVFFRLFFYERYLIELDIFTIIFAGVGLTLIIPKIITQKQFIGVFMVIGMIFIASDIAHIARYKPFISKNEFYKIHSLCTITKENNVVMATHSYYSPWLYGFSCREVFAPGMFERNSWTKEQWNAFWGGPAKQKQELIQETFKEETVYVFIGEKQKTLSFHDIERFTKIDNYLWKWN